MTNAVDSPLSAIGRFFGLGALVVGGAFLAVFAAAAALVVGLMVTGAALALRFAPRPAPIRNDVLEARRTPAGWVVEASSRRKS